ncbi:hypothetical protein [Nocardia farcinica]
MPIRPENRGRYPAAWRAISDWVRFTRARGRCECRGECGRPPVHLAGDGRCPNEHGQRSHHTGSPVVLTTAHLDHTPEHCEPENLRAMCQGCHLHYDRDRHAETRAATRRADLERQMEPLFELGGDR